MQDRKLEQVLDVYFQDEPDKGSKEFQEAQKYLKLRIRPAMEFLIEKEDTDRMEQLEKCGWFSIKELEKVLNESKKAIFIRVMGKNKAGKPQSIETKNDFFASDYEVCALCCDSAYYEIYSKQEETVLKIKSRVAGRCMGKTESYSTGANQRSASATLMPVRFAQSST